MSQCIIIIIFHLTTVHIAVDNLGMEGANIGVNERRPSAAVPPSWLEPKAQPYTNVFVAGSSGDNAAGQSGRLSPAHAQAAAAAEASALEEGYHLKIPPKIMINDPHDRNYTHTKLLSRHFAPCHFNCPSQRILFTNFDCFDPAACSLCSLLMLLINLSAQLTKF